MATLVKLIGNFLLISATNSMKEALALAEAKNVDSKAIVDMLTKTLFPAPIYQSIGKMITEKITPAQSDIPMKDIGLLLETARQENFPMPVASLLSDLLLDNREKI